MITNGYFLEGKVEKSGYVFNYKYLKDKSKNKHSPIQGINGGKVTHRIEIPEGLDIPINAKVVLCSENKSYRVLSCNITPYNEFQSINSYFDDTDQITVLELE